MCLNFIKLKSDLDTVYEEYSSCGFYVYASGFTVRMQPLKINSFLSPCRIRTIIETTFLS